MVKLQPSKLESDAIRDTVNDTYNGPLDHDNTTNDTTKDDAELSRVVSAWPELPATIRAGILAMVKAAGTAREDTGV